MRELEFWRGIWYVDSEWRILAVMYGTSDGREGSWMSASAAADFPPWNRYLESGSHVRPSAPLPATSVPHVMMRGLLRLKTTWNEVMNEIIENIIRRL